MFVCSRIRRWVPKYFSTNKSFPRRKNEALNSRIPRGASKSSRCNSYQLPPHMSTTHHEVKLSPDESSAEQVLVARAARLLSQLQTCHYDPREQSYVHFSARQEVLSTITRLLPPPVPSSVAKRSAAQPHPAARRRKLQVIPEQCVKDPLKYVNSRLTTSMEARGVSESNRAIFSLDQLVTLLQLYEAVGYEDGQLLLQLMSAVRHEVEAISSPPSTREHAGPLALKMMNTNRGQGKLPLPNLLLVLAELGLVEEDLLQRLVARHPPQTTTHSDHISNDGYAKQPSNCSGLLYKQLPLYSEVDLLVLLAALHRFGLHQENIFESTVKALRRCFWDSRSATSVFIRRSRALEKKLRSTLPPASSELGNEAPLDNSEPSRVHDAARIQGDSNRNWVQCLPPLPQSLQCPLCLLLEVLTSMTLSVHRRVDVVAFLASLIAVTAAKEIRSVKQQSSSDVVLHHTSHHLHRAVKLCESVETPQSLLAEVFLWSCTASGKHVVVDGGESAGIPAEKVAFYDHVTADLVKVDYASVVKANSKAPLTSNTTNTGTAASAKEVPATLTPRAPLATAATPYIPSYLAALQSNNPPYTPSHPPVANAKAEVLCLSTSVSTPLHDPESTSSWADDDESFVQSVFKSQQSTTVQRTGSPANEPCGRKERQAGGRPGKRSDASHKKNAKGWRTTQEPSRANARRAGVHRPDAARTNSLISGGRFDALANEQLKRHL